MNLFQNLFSDHVIIIVVNILSETGIVQLVIRRSASAQEKRGVVPVARAVNVFDARQIIGVLVHEAMSVRLL